MNLIRWKTVIKSNFITAKGSILPVIAGVAGLISINLISERLQLTDISEDQFAVAMHSVIGTISITIIGPIIEELCCREAICGGLLRNGVKPWTAILVSALLFGLLHGNPVQMFCGFLMGIILGMFYVKSGNIILPSILHILNNGLSTLLTLKFGNNTVKLSELLGGDCLSAIIGIVCFVFCVCSMIIFWRKQQTPEFESALENK